MSILENGMLVDVAISMWDGRRLDRKASRQAVEDHHAQDDQALRVNKLLVSKDAMAPFMTAASAIRTHHKDKTLPWRDKGARLLPRKLYMPFIERHAELEQAYVDAVDDFCFNKYPAEIDRASFRLGSAFDPSDYESPERLRKRFSVTVDIDAINDPSDFRVQMEEDQVERIRADIQEKTERRVAEAMSHVWERVEETVTHFAKRMASQTEASEGKRRSPLHATTLTNLQKLVDALPAMNITNDKKLAKLQVRLQKTIYGYTIDDLKGKPENCEAAAAEAENILEDFSGIFAAMRGANAGED